MRIILGTVIALVAIGSIVATTRPGRVAYHKWRLRVAIENARTAGEGKPTRTQEFISLLRGQPATSAEYEEAWRRHEDALVKLNVLARREFVLPGPVASEDRGRIVDAAEREFGSTGLWSVTSLSRNAQSILVTALPGDIPRWEELLYSLCEEQHVVRRYGFVRPRQMFAW
jgi:hypothetical protein